MDVSQSIADVKKCAPGYHVAKNTNKNRLPKQKIFNLIHFIYIIHIIEGVRQITFV